MTNSTTGTLVSVLILAALYLSVPEQTEGCPVPTPPFPFGPEHSLSNSKESFQILSSSPQAFAFAVFKKAIYLCHAILHIKIISKCAGSQMLCYFQICMLPLLHLQSSAFILHRNLIFILLTTLCVLMALKSSFSRFRTLITAMFSGQLYFNVLQEILV